MLIELRSIRRSYRMGEIEIEALRPLDLDIDHGAYVAIMGPSGSGKSTLLHLLGCLDRPSGGDYRLGGRSVGALDDEELAQLRNQEIGFVFQSFHLLPRATARQNVELPLIYAGVPPGERRRMATEALEQVDLVDRSSHRPGQLSGGQRQRVAIARALVQQPSLLLADEPTGNLDSATGEGILRILDGLHDRGHSIIMVTHEAALAAHADRVVRLRDGAIEFDGPPHG